MPNGVNPYQVVQKDTNWCETMPNGKKGKIPGDEK